MLPTDDPVPAAVPPATLGARLALRLPEIVIQALFLLVAVVLAFAVEEWREARELDRLALEARNAILQEVARNRDELVESSQETSEAIGLLDAALASPAPGGTEPRQLPVNLELALLSSAAWNTAQSTEASRRMNYAWMLQVSQAYELQALYHQAQWTAVEALVTLKSTTDEASQLANARALLGRIRLARSLGETLQEDYDAITKGAAGAK